MRYSVQFYSLLDVVDNDYTRRIITCDSVQYVGLRHCLRLTCVLKHDDSRRLDRCPQGTDFALDRHYLFVKKRTSCAGSAALIGDWVGMGGLLLGKTAVDAYT